MAFLTDSLRAAIAACNPFARRDHAPMTVLGAFQHQLAFAAYASSGMLRKVIAIPADDRVREWRDWQADKEAIALIEAEERRLQLQAKTKQAEILRGIGGGAMILITAGSHSEPLTPDQIKAGGLVAINVVSRWQIQGKDWVTDLADPAYGTPRMFSISSSTSGEQLIHPSRVVAFRGEPIPMGTGVSMEEAYWGDSRLLRVFTEVERSDQTQAWFAALVRKAKLLRFGIPKLSDFTASAEGTAKLMSRVALIAEGENSLNASVYDMGDGEGGANPGEKIDDYQITWAGIPAVMDAFDQRVAAVADIPFTRLMGRSPAGMNATGDHDTDNWNKMVASGQKLETRPCLEQIDPILLRSAGVAAPDDVTWRFAPLDTPTEQEEATTFKTSMEAIEKLQNTGTIPDEAFAKGVQNWLEEREYLPGLGAALAEIPENERFGLAPDDDGDDPSVLQAKGGDPDDLPEGGAVPRSARRAANDAATWLADATPRPLYVQRKLLNAADLIAWAKANGFDTTLPAPDMHVTVLYSRAPVDPMKMGRDWREDEQGRITVRPGGPRVIERLGENAVVLRFASPDLEWRHKDLVEAGGSHDWPEYAPHVTLSYAVPEGVDLDALKPFNGELRFGPEIFEALDLDWKQKVREK
jgi:phage-related protein (TIGR01555 family)